MLPPYWSEFRSENNLPKKKPGSGIESSEKIDIKNPDPVQKPDLLLSGSETTGAQFLMVKLSLHKKNTLIL